MKNKKKRLVIAVSMLLISAALLGTASFAWFGMNTSVKATGVEVEAYSDSQFLQISASNSDGAFGTSVTYSEEGQKDLRLVTHGVISSAKTEVVKLTLSQPLTNGVYSAQQTNGTPVLYYMLADSDASGAAAPADANAKNVICVNDSLQLADKVQGLYKGLVFEMATGTQNWSSGTYYEKVGNSYKEKTLTTSDRVHGYYQIWVYTQASGNAVSGTQYYEKAGDVYTPVTAELEEGVTPVSTYFTRSAPAAIGDANERYDGTTVFYKYDSTNKVYSKVDYLKLGSSLVGYYTVQETAVTETNFGTGYYYIKNGNDYSCLGKPGVGADGQPVTVPVAGYIYWGRAYSSQLNNAQSGNTLNIVNATDAAESYYLAKTLYLRQAEGTNHGTGLKVESVSVGGTANSLNSALRVLFVAKSLVTNEVKVTEYDNGNAGSFNGELFGTILGNKAEVIQVDMYIYYDGQDAAATNAAVATLNGQTVEIAFSIDELPYN